MQKKQKFNLVDSVKAQAPTGQIDLSNKNIGDMHMMQICQLLKLHCTTGVKRLDLSSNKVSDEGVMSLIKAVCET